MTVDVIHSTQYFLKLYINKAILANLQHRPLKLDRLIVLQETTVAIKILFPWQPTLFQSPLTGFQYLSDFQLEKTLNGATNAS